MEPLIYNYNIYNCGVLFQNTSQIRLLAFDRVLSLMIMNNFPEPPLSENALQCFTPATTSEVSLSLNNLLTNRVVWPISNISTKKLYISQFFFILLLL